MQNNLSRKIYPLRGFLIVAAMAVVLFQVETGYSWQDEGPIQLTSPLGRSLHAQADEGDAPARFRSALATAPDSVGLWMRLGLALAGSWRYQQAIDAYSEGLVRDPFNALLYRHRGHRQACPLLSFFSSAPVSLSWLYRLSAARCRLAPR